MPFNKVSFRIHKAVGDSMCDIGTPTLCYNISIHKVEINESQNKIYVINTLSCITIWLYIFKFERSCLYFTLITEDFGELLHMCISVLDGM